MRASTVRWEANGHCITVNGTVFGSTMYEDSAKRVAHWLNSLTRSELRMFVRELTDGEFDFLKGAPR